MVDNNNKEKTGSSDKEKKAGVRGLLGSLFRPSARWSVFALLCVGIAIALAGVIGFEASMAYSSSDEFCSTSCHEMTDNPYADLKNTIHYYNHSGVTAGCADCHIPKPFIPKMVRKVHALREVWGHVTGIIDTPEKYAAHAEAMKSREVARIRANDSAECRNCHNPGRMLPELQSPEARKYHQLMHEGDKTCIDCHQGIAHPSTGQVALNPGIGDAREVKPQQDGTETEQDPTTDTSEQSGTSTSD